MQLGEEYDVSGRHDVGTCLLVLLMLISIAVTSQSRQTFLSKINNMRFDVTAENVTTHSAADCYMTCQQTSACVSVNLSPAISEVCFYSCYNLLA